MEDTKDFEAIYRSHYSAVATAVSRFRITDGAADDIIQDTFVQAWQSLSSLREPKAIRGWLITIARNNCLKAIKRQKPTVSIANSAEQTDNAQGQEVTLVADDLMASLHFEHSLEVVRELVQSHETEPRATIAKKFYIEGQSVKQITEDLALKQNTVLSHLRRFRLIISKAILEVLDEKGIQWS